MGWARMVKDTRFAYYSPRAFTLLYFSSFRFVSSAAGSCTLLFVLCDLGFGLWTLVAMKLGLPITSLARMKLSIFQVTSIDDEEHHHERFPLWSFDVPSSSWGAHPQDQHLPRHLDYQNPEHPLLPSFAGPNHHHHHHEKRPRSPPTRRLRRRVMRTAMVLVSGMVVLGVWVWWSGVPPGYGDVREFERGLPQHRRWREVPEGVELRLGGGGGGRDGDGEVEGEARYLRFPDHVWGHGFNNVLQEVYVFLILPFPPSIQTP